MFARIKRSRLARAAAVLFLVPVVVFSNPHTAHAAGEWHEVEVLATSATGNSSCWLAFQQDGAGALDVAGGAYCLGGPDVSPGMSQTGEAGSSYTVVVSGTDANGAACGNTIGGTLGSHPQNGTANTAGVIGAHSMALGTTDCTITLVCVVLEGDTNGFVVDRAEGCQAVNIPPAEPVEQECVGGTPHVTHKWEQIATNQYQSVLTFTRYGAPASTAQWGYAILYHDNSWAQGNWTSTNEARPNIVGWGGGPPPDPKGVQLYAYTGDGWNSPVPDPKAAVIGGVRPTTPGLSYGGWTQPTRCRFWFGPQIVTDNSTDEDDPFGDLTTPYVPPTTPEPTPPPVAEPPDGFDWLAAIFGLLQRLLSVIGGLAAAIANAIIGALGDLIDAVLDGLVSLFVPGDGFFEDKADQAADAFEGSTLDNYLAVVEGMVPAGASGCEGPAVNFSSFGFDAGSQHPLSACGGPASTAAAATRLAISVGLGLSATFACIRILGRSLGWDPGLGGGHS